MKNLFYILYPILFLLLAACRPKQNTSGGQNHELEQSTTAMVESHHDEDDDHTEGNIHLSRAQIKTIGLEFGAFTPIKLADYVKATGLLGVPPNNTTTVSPKAEGIIRSNAKFVEGDFIKKGTLVGYLENPDFITIQQEYLQTKANMAFTKTELERQSFLIKENAGVQRNLQKLQAELNAQKALLMGLEKQLDYLGINTTALSPDNIVHKTAIHAPSSGYIASIQMNDGMYANPTNPLLQIISVDHIHLELDVFEKDISKIKKGQRISYNIPALGPKIYEGEVSVISKEFEISNKTVRVHGHVEKEKPPFIKDLFVDAKIWLNDGTVNALPEEAIVEIDGASYVYAAINDDQAEELEFEKLLVKTGATDKGYTEVQLIDSLSENQSIVTKGAYYIYAQSKVGELSHDH